MSVFDIILPRSCRLCGRRLQPDEQMICWRCFHQLDLLHLESNLSDNLMARLLWGHFVPERCFSLMRYAPEGFGASLIHDLKYRGDYDIGVFLGYVAALMAMRKLPHAGWARLAWHGDAGRNMQPFFEGIDLIVPMPLHRNRLRQRGYNQSVAIAEGIRMATGIKIEKRAVLRQRDTVTQTQLAGKERRDNTAGAFMLKRPERIAGRHLLIVDDVMTTGSTISALATELLKAEDVSISVLTAALSTSRVLL